MPRRSTAGTSKEASRASVALDLIRGSHRPRPLPAAMAETEETMKSEKPPAGIPTGGFLIVADGCNHDWLFLTANIANLANGNPQAYSLTSSSFFQPRIPTPKRLADTPRAKRHSALVAESPTPIGTLPWEADALCLPMRRGFRPSPA